MKHSLIFIFSAFANFCFSQNDSTKTYSYPFCEYSLSNEESKLIINTTYQKTDTAMAYVVGKILDFKKNAVTYASISFENTETVANVTQSNSDGDFKIYLQPNKYKLRISAVAYSKLDINNFIVKSGELKQLEVKLGQKKSIDCGIVIISKPLSKRKLKQLNKHK